MLAIGDRRYLTDIKKPVKQARFHVGMAQVLILYATTEGHTVRVAERMAQGLRAQGHEVQALRAEPGAMPPDFERYDGVIVGASVHYGRHPGHLRALLRQHGAALAARRSAFFSVSLSARHKPQAAQRYLQTFLRQAGWQPQQTATFAGALPYSKYAPWKRLLMIAFVALAGGDTDASRDYEYTDWDAVDRFAEDFADAV
jgi:menaquinone-dependent protoporphyrinogen oxidase